MEHRLNEIACATAYPMRAASAQQAKLSRKIEPCGLAVAERGKVAYIGPSKPGRNPN
jgi:hypothetical protein